MIVSELNKLIGRELGTNPFGEPIYLWEFSEDLFWPAYKTGRNVVKQTPGGLYITEPEYFRDRQTHTLRDQWVITKWISPEQLAGHWNWHSMFPGAGLPQRGYRIKTDWYNKPGVLPSLEDTRCFFRAIRMQVVPGYDPQNPDAHGIENGKRLRREMDAETDHKEASAQREIEDCVRDSFGAFLNPKPGARGNFVSFPSTEKEKKESLTHG